MAVSFSGSLDISGSLSTTGTITMSGSIASASFATTASNAVTSSYVVSSQTDATQNTRLTTIEAVTGSYASTSSLSLTSSSVAAINVRTGSYATTGSNYFIGTQVITGSVYISSDLVVQGSSSLQNITASAVSIGTNTVILNTSTPILRFGGISVQDSGSSQGRSGSLYWDSLNDHWIYVVPSGSSEGYNSAMLMNGPKNTGSLGSEGGLTTGYVPRSQGEDHLEDSNIFSSASLVGIGTTSPTTLLDLYKTSYPVCQIGSGTVTGNMGIDTSNNFMYVGTTTNHPLVLGSNNTERIRVASNGNVGIGLSSPSTKLHVSSTSGSANASAPPSLGFANSSSVALFTNFDAAYGTLFGTTNAGNGWIQQQRVDGTGTAYSLTLQPTSGNVGIGTMSPSTTLHVLSPNAQSLIIATTSATTLYQTYRYNTSTDVGYIGNGTGVVSGGSASDFGFLSTGNMVFGTGGSSTERMRILSSGNVGIGVTAPVVPLQVGSGSVSSIPSWMKVITTDTTQSGVGAVYNNKALYMYNNGSELKLDAYDYSTGAALNVQIGGNGGKIGIGTSSPVTTLDVAGSISVTTGGGSVIWKNTSSSNKRWDISSNGNDFSFNETGVNQRMVILAGGFVGIGTTSPGTKFQVRDTTSAWVANFENNAGTESVGVYLSHGDGYGIAIDSSENDSKYIFKAMAGSGGGGGRGSVPVIYAQHNGLVGIGVTSPQRQFVVSANGGQGLEISNESGYSNILCYNRATSTYTNLVLGEGTGKVGIGTTNPASKLEVNGTITESSSIRYKENIETLTSGLDKVSQMRGVSYIKKDTQTKEIGVIAEEINEILPDVVIKNNEGEVESVAYGRLTAILIEAVKELKAEIDVLKSK
jgi:hypothetical protein